MYYLDACDSESCKDVGQTQDPGYCDPGLELPHAVCTPYLGYTLTSRACVFIQLAPTRTSITIAAMDVSELVAPLLGALQASISVLLTIAYGVIAAQFDLLNGDAAKQVSRIAVRLFLPALLITSVGSQIHQDTAVRYVPVLSKSRFISWSIAHLRFG